MRFTPTQVRVLWCLRRRGGKYGKITVGKSVRNIYSFIADETNLRHDSVRNALQQLEVQSVVIRVYKRPNDGVFGAGHNPLISVEMVDPKMELPPCPPPLPLAVVVAHENEELAERTAHEPDRDDVLEALLNRNTELQEQINKLHALVERLNEELESQKKRSEKRRVPEHLTSRVQDALTSEQWEALRHK